MTRLSYNIRCASCAESPRFAGSHINFKMLKYASNAEGRFSTGTILVVGSSVFFVCLIIAISTRLARRQKCFGKLGPETGADGQNVIVEIITRMMQRFGSGG